MWKQEVIETNVAIALVMGQCGEDTWEVSPPIAYDRGWGPGKFSYFRC